MNKSIPSPCVGVCDICPWKVIHKGLLYCNRPIQLSGPLWVVLPYPKVFDYDYDDDDVKGFKKWLDMIRESVMEVIQNEQS